jgi:cephalosporin-C deacetylase-like acetyl esterase
VLCERPEWDGQTVAALGIHQGATLALVAAALDSRVSFVAAASPVLCDIGRAFSLNAKPWPGLEPVLPPGLAPELQAGSLLYLDCAHLAPRIRVPSHVSIGLYDALSPPAGVAAACNRFGSTPKVVLDDPESGGPSMRTREILDRSVREHLARKLLLNKR